MQYANVCVLIRN